MRISESQISNSSGLGCVWRGRTDTLLRGVKGAAMTCIVASTYSGSALGATSEPGYGCLVEPYQRVDIRSAVEGRIDALRADRGSDVRKGQVLVELESSLERAALESAQFRAVMEGQLRSAESRLDAAKQKFERRDQLVRDGFISTQDRDDALAEWRIAQAGVVEARENQRLADLERRRLTEVVEQRRIRSPVDGVVTDRLQAVGEIAQAGENAKPILKVAQVHPLRVEAVIPVSALGRIRVGARAEIEIEPPIAGRHRAMVTIVDRVIDSASGTFGVRLELPNASGAIPAGVKCKVRFGN